MLKKSPSSQSVRLILNLILSLSVAFSPILSYADTDNISKRSDEASIGEVSEPEVSTREQIEQLRYEVLGRATQPGSLDPFMMVRQQVIDERKEKVEALVKEEALSDFENKKRILSLSKLKTLKKSSLKLQVN